VFLDDGCAIGMIFILGVVRAIHELEQTLDANFMIYVVVLSSANHGRCKYRDPYILSHFDYPQTIFLTPVSSPCSTNIYSTIYHIS
jgi:hypothetical protein